MMVEFRPALGFEGSSSARSRLTARATSMPRVRAIRCAWRPRGLTTPSSSWRASPSACSERYFALWIGLAGGFTRAPRRLRLVRARQLGQAVDHLRRELPGVDRARPAGEVDVKVLPDLDLELAAVERDEHWRVAAAQHVVHRRAAGTGAARHRLPDAALEHPRTQVTRLDLAPEADVGAVREEVARLDRLPELDDVELYELVDRVDVDRALRIADRRVAKVPAAAPPRRSCRSRPRARPDNCPTSASRGPCRRCRCLGEATVARISPAIVWIENWRASVQPALTR